MLTINNLQYLYNPENLIFNEVSFEVADSEIVSIIGRSGLGKTTLLNLISGLLKPSQGEVKLNGSNIKSPQLNISYLKQKQTLLFYKNVLENALLSIQIRGQFSEDKTQKVNNLLEKFGLKSAIQKFPDELSEGMKQRVGIIQTLISEADLYLLDEPFSSIDNFYSKVIEEDIWKQFKKAKASAIFVLHDLEQALAISDKIMLLPSDKKDPIIIHLSENLRKLSPVERRKHHEFPKQLLQVVQIFSQN